VEEKPRPYEEVIFMRSNGRQQGPFNRETYYSKSAYYGIPDHIDAALTVTGVRKGRPSAEFTFIFAKASYYLYEGFRYRAGPFSIHSANNNPKYNLLNLQLPRYVTRVDGAMFFRNKRMYFFAGKQFWRYNFSPNDYYRPSNRMDPGYPKAIRRAWGVEGPIDAVISDEELGYTYFLKGNQAYKLHPKQYKLEAGFPQHMGYALLDCGGRAAVPPKRRLYSSSKTGQSKHRYKKVTAKDP
jgi:hypothetical protein